MKLLIVNGPNLNLLGIREPEIYGKKTYADLVESIKAYAAQGGDEVAFFQSNHEGALVDAIQQAYFDGVEGIVINPAAYTHTSVAILDALKGVGIPFVEVHISAVDEREVFRRVSYVQQAALACVTGKGFDGYLEAVDILRKTQD